MFQLSHGDLLLPLCDDLVFSHFHLLMRSCLHDFLLEGYLSEYLFTNTGGGWSPVYLTSINHLVPLRLRMTFSQAKGAPSWCEFQPKTATQNILFNSEIVGINGWSSHAFSFKFSNLMKHRRYNGITHTEDHQRSNSCKKTLHSDAGLQHRQKVGLMWSYGHTTPFSLSIFATRDTTALMTKCPPALANSPWSQLHARDAWLSKSLVWREVLEVLGQLGAV